jgi:hypothetical protein
MPTPSPVLDRLAPKQPPTTDRITLYALGAGVRRCPNMSADLLDPWAYSRAGTTLGSAPGTANASATSRASSSRGA